jgi:hypothetical protein
LAAQFLQLCTVDETPPGVLAVARDCDSEQQIVLTSYSVTNHVAASLLMDEELL